VADQPLTFAGDRVDRARGMRFLGQPIDQRYHALLVGDRDVRTEEFIGPDLVDRVRQLQRRPIPQFVGGIDALRVERSLLHRT
jgi:hypothetical protein